MRQPEHVPKLIHHRFSEFELRIDSSHAVIGEISSDVSPIASADGALAIHPGTIAFPSPLQPITLSPSIARRMTGAPA